MLQGWVSKFGSIRICHINFSLGMNLCDNTLTFVLYVCFGFSFTPLMEFSSVCRFRARSPLVVRLSWIESLLSTFSHANIEVVRLSWTLRYGSPLHEVFTSNLVI